MERAAVGDGDGALVGEVVGIDVQIAATAADIDGALVDDAVAGMTEPARTEVGVIVGVALH